MVQPLSLSAVPRIAELLFCLLTQYGHRSYGNGEALPEERDRLRQPQYDSTAWWQGAL